MQSVSNRKSARTGLRLGLAGLILAVGGLTLIPATAAGATVGAAGNRHPQLTAEQKTCLDGQGITRPEKGTRPTAEQRAAFKTAATACGIELPARGGHRRSQLTAEQKTCLEGQGVTKPEKGTRPTAEQRAAIKTAATACGITLPARAS